MARSENLENVKKKNQKKRKKKAWQTNFKKKPINRLTNARFSGRLTEWGDPPAPRL